MKKFLFTLTLGIAFALGSHSALAQAKKKPAEADKPAAEAPKAAPGAKANADKPIPMYVHADEIDAKAKTITQVTKEGKKGVNTVTASTEIMNGDKPAKFEDIKVGEYVSGLRKKTGENAYEVVKITKFGPKAAKPAAGAKPGTEAKPKK